MAAGRYACILLRTFAGVLGVDGGRSPRFLNEARTAGLTLVAARVVLTSADETRLVARVVHVAAVGVAVTDAPAADRYVLNTVVVLKITSILSGYWRFCQSIK